MYNSSKQIKKKPNTGSNEFNPTTQSSSSNQQQQQQQQQYKCTPTYDLPFILTQAINNDESKQQQFNDELSGSLSSRDGTCFIIYSGELFIWTIDKPQYCDRIELPINEIITRQHIVVIKNKIASDRFSVFCCSPMTGYIKYWGNTSKPNISQDLHLESPPHNNNGTFKIYITECQPFGVIVGNSNGSIFLVSVKNNNNLISKKINKSQGMLSYLYLSRQSPIVSVFSSPSSQQQSSQPFVGSTVVVPTTTTSRDVYILTEGSLLKYEIINGSERIVLDYPIYKEIQSSKYFQQSSNNMKFHQMYIDTILDQNKDEIQLINLVLYETSASLNQVKYYILQIEVQQDKILKINKIDRFISIKKLSGGIVSTEPNLHTNSLKYYLTWDDMIYYYSKGIGGVQGNISFQNGGIAFSGFYKNQFYFFSENGINKLDIQPYGVGQFASSELHIQDTIEQSSNNNDDMMVDGSGSGNSNSPILFDIPKDDSLISNKRNNILKLMNSFSLKQYSKVDQLVKIIKSSSSGGSEFDSIIKQVSLWIIDQQPSSKFWADDSNLLNIFGKEISVQLNQQLEDKKKRYQFFITCLKDTELYKLLSAQTIDFLNKNEIKIKSAIVLRNYQNQKEPLVNKKGTVSSNSIFPQLIQSLVKERNPDWTNIGMNVYELFYSNVSGIDQILINIVSKLQDQLHGGVGVGGVGTKVQILLEGCELFNLVLTTYPVEYLNFSIFQNISIDSLLSKIIQILIQFIQLEFNSTSFAANQILFKRDLGISNIDKSLYNYLFKFTEKYLYSLKINQFEQFNQYKTKLIEPFIEFNKFEEAVLLANEFDDYFTYINVYCSSIQLQQDGGSGSGKKDDKFKLIIDCLNKFSSIGILTKVYQYMLERDLKSEILQLPSEFNESLFKFLSSSSSTNFDLCWLHSIRMKNWSNVSNILYQKSISTTGGTGGTGRMTLKEKKKNLSLSKVSLLSSGSTSSNDSNSNAIVLQPTQQIQMDIINQNLALINWQKLYFSNKKEVLTVSELILLILQLNNQIMSNGNGNEGGEEGSNEKLINLINCIEIISESKLLLKKDEIRELLKLVLENSINSDSLVFFEKPISDIQLSYSLKETNFFKLISLNNFPKEIASILVNQIIEDYFKFQISNNTNNINNSTDDKRQFQISLARLLELSKYEINLKQ